MRINNRHLATLAALCALSVLIGGSCTTGHKRAHSSLAEMLERSPLIELVIVDWETGNLRPEYINRPEQLQAVREWNRKHAWPPIDLRNVGAVIPRGYFTVFEEHSSTSLSFRIHAYGSTSRKAPEKLHVSDADWQTLLSLLPQTG